MELSHGGLGSGFVLKVCFCSDSTVVQRTLIANSTKLAKVLT